MQHRTLVATLAGAVAALSISGGAVALAASGDSDTNVTGPAADRAVAAALAETGGGTANSVERDSEDGAVWEVEVTKPGGSTVDVRLDRNLNVVVVEPDGPESGNTGDTQDG
jgi:hypothetical protein